MKTVLLFDYDDTLVQTRQCKFAAIKALGMQLHRAFLSDEDIEAHWGKPYRQFFGDLFNVGDMALDKLLQEYERYNDVFPMRLHEDAGRMIHSLSRKYDCGIVSSASAKRIQAQLDTLGVSQACFTYLQGAEATLAHKPDPAVFEPAIAAMRARHENDVDIIYIGDAYNDYCAAQEAGLRFIGVARRLNDLQWMRKSGVQLITTLDELPTSI